MMAILSQFNVWCLSTYFVYFLKIGQVGRVFANGQEDLGSIPDRVILKTLKKVLDTSLLNTQHYKVRIKSKEEQSRETNSALGVVAFEKGACWSSSTMVSNFTFNFNIKLKYSDFASATSIYLSIYLILSLSLSIYIYIYIYNKIWHKITSKGWYAIKTNQTTKQHNTHIHTHTHTTDIAAIPWQIGLLVVF